MSTFWITILEIIKISVSGLIVFATVYYLLKRYNEGQLALKQTELRLAEGKDGMSLKLQALERLTLLCERISIPNLLLRIRTPDMNNSMLKIALLLAIQQEYEHNVTQQLYVSEALWEILDAAKEQTTQVIEKASEGIDPKADGKELASRLLNYSLQNQKNASDIAIQALKKEAAILIA